MKEWLETGMQQVRALLETDADFQDLTGQLTDAGRNYRSVIQKLPAKDREIIEYYLALCEEVEFQKILAAYHCGKEYR